MPTKGNPRYLVKDLTIQLDKGRQNFDAVMHIISASHLLDDIPRATGTKLYTDIIQQVVDSYLDAIFCLCY